MTTELMTPFRLVSEGQPQMTWRATRICCRAYWVTLVFSILWEGTGRWVQLQELCIVGRRGGVEKREHFLKCPLVSAPLSSQLPWWAFILPPWQMAGGSDARPSWRRLDHPDSELCYFPSSPTPGSPAQLKCLLVVPLGFCKRNKFNSEVAASVI